MDIASLCVFCGSHTGSDRVYSDAAKRVGEELADRRIRLIYGGGKVGLMGVLADAALQRGGEVIGVIPQFLMDKELGHGGVTELHVVRSMHERKSLMADLSNGFIGLPGGFGTLEELCEIITWSQLGLSPKPVGVLNVNGYFEPLLQMFDRGVTDGFIRPQHRQLVLARENVDELLSEMSKFAP